MKNEPYKINSIYKSTASSNEIKIENEKLNILVYPFDNYEINVIVDSQDRFIGIQSLKIKKDMLPLKHLSYSNKFSAEKLIDDFLNSCED